MKRTFQAKTTIQQFVMLAVLIAAIVCICCISMPKALTGALTAIVLYLATVVISRMVSTFYIIHSEGYMEIKKGRLTSDTKIQLAEVRQIDKVRRSGTIVIVMNDGKEYCLIPPKNEEDFINCIKKYHPQS